MVRKVQFGLLSSLTLAVRDAGTGRRPGFLQRATRGPFRQERPTGGRAVSLASPGALLQVAARLEIIMVFTPPIRVQMSTVTISLALLPI